MKQVKLPQMLRAGVRAVSDYTGTFLGLFVVQVLIAFGAGLTIWRVLAAQFATRPMFDEGVDGDIASLIEALRHADNVFLAIRWIAFGAIVLWAMLSWFLASGLIAVLAERPHGRRETARVFGAAGAGHFLVMARLGFLSLCGHLVVVVAAMLGLDAVYPRIEHALTLSTVIFSLIAGLLPAVLLLAALWAIIDYARVELVLRRPTHERLGAAVAFARAVVFVVRRPIAIAHVLLWMASFLVVSIVFAWAAFGHAMLGVSGAIALTIVREGVSLLRMGLKVALVGGQVELGTTRKPPPRATAEAA